jgi:hypothetical protein
LFCQPFVEGPSLAPILEGRVAKVKDIAIASPSLLASAEKPPSPADRSSITDGEWLLIYGAQRHETADGGETAAVDSIIRKVRDLQEEIQPELYHITQDPKCEENLISEKHSVAVRLHSAFLEFLESKKYPKERLNRLSPRTWAW